MDDAFRVLLIEDSPEDAELLRLALAQDRRARWNVEWAQGLAAGLDTLKLGLFDGVLLDLGLPDSAGMQGLRRILAQASTMAVIVLTGMDDETTAMEAIKAGAEDYVVKGSATEELLPRCLRYAIERARTRDELRETEERFRDLVERAPDIIYRTDELGHFTYVNSAARRTMGYSLEELRGIRLLDLIRSDCREAAAEFYAKQAQGRIAATYYEFPAIARDGSEVWIGQNVRFLPRGQGCEAVARDITERKKAEQDREDLISKLEAALLNVKRLSGLLPMCASCKKVRNDQGYWREVDNYLREHAEIRVSHGVCPDCAKTLYPDIFKKLYPDS